MKKTILMLIIVFASNLYANCLPKIQEDIKLKEQKLLFSKLKQKKAIKVTALSTFIPASIFWGVMGKLLIDGGTILSSVAVGATFGTVVTGGVVGVVAIPMITYNQILKGKIRGLKKSFEVIQASEDYDYSNPQLRRLYKKVLRKHKSLTVEELVSIINTENVMTTFCPENQISFTFNKLKRYLNKELTQEDQLNLVF